MIQVSNAAELGEPYRHQISEVFCSAFAEDFSGFSKDPAVLADAFAHALLLDRWWVSLIDGSVAAVATLTEAGQTCLRHDRSTFIRYLGPLRGRIASRVFRSSFEPARPGLEPGAVDIGFVGSSPRYRGRGAAKALLRRLLELPDHRVYRLEEIKDTNTAALRLYQGLGFSEYKRRRVHHTVISGFRAYVSMQLIQPD